MHPFAPHYERKTRSDHGKKRLHESNASSSSTTLNHPSSSHPLDDTIDENDDESFHSNSSSPSQNVSSSSNFLNHLWHPLPSWDVYTNYDDAYEINHDGNEEEELCEVYEPPVCNIRKYRMIKYSFNNNEDCVAIKEDEYDDLTITRKEAYQAYQEIFQKKDEGWKVTRTMK
ncbi:hypothetical protein Tco_0217706 [Tanacetum coccineum]